MKREELIFNLALLAVIIAMLVVNLNYRPGARQVPMLTGICTVGLLVAITIGPFKRTNRKERPGRIEVKAPALDAPPENGTAAFPGGGKDAVIIIWLLFLMVASYLIGFLLAIPLYMFLFLFIFARESWKLSIGVAIGVFAVIYLVFVKVLNVQLYKGLLL